MTERQLQYAVAQYFAAVLDPARVLWFHPMNEGKRGKLSQADFKLGGGLAGVADWYLAWQWKGPDAGVIYQTTAWIELKSTKGRLTLAQEAFRERVLGLGHWWALRRDLVA